MQFRVIVVTDPQTNKYSTNPQTGPITIYCTTASAQSNKPETQIFAFLKSKTLVGANRPGLDNITLSFTPPPAEWSHTGISRLAVSNDVITSTKVLMFLSVLVSLFVC